MKRKIVHIDEAKCDGCGLCVDACHEGAIQLVDGKARLVSDIYCDGLGDCLGECPQGAITIEERDAEPFDAKAVETRLSQTRTASPSGGCPGLARLSIERPNLEGPTPAATAVASSALSQWPIQLSLVPVAAPYWDGADLLISADCVAHAKGDFHTGLLAGKRLIIACPKLDNTSGYLDKLTAILANNDIRSVTVAHMEVPCCTGLVRLVEEAVDRSGKNLSPTRTCIAIDGTTRS